MSDKYKQGKELLNDKNCYSVWGVACEVFQERTKELVTKTVNGITLYDNNRRSLPLKVTRYFGINEATEHYINYLCNDKDADFEEAVVELIERFDLLERKSIAYYGSYGWGCD